MTFPQNNPITDTSRSGPASVEVSGPYEIVEDIVKALQENKLAVSQPNTITENELIAQNSGRIICKFEDQDSAELFEEGLTAAASELKWPIQTHVIYDTLSHPGNVYIRGFGSDATAGELLELVSKFGNVTACKVVCDSVSGKSRGFGFVNFGSGHAARAAIDALTGYSWKGNTLYLNRHISKKERIARLRAERANFKNLYVKNIPSSLSDEEILKLFEEYGEIDSYFLPRTDADPPLLKGYGFVKYSDHEAASKAMEELQDVEIQNHKLHISRAQRREERNMNDSLSHRKNKPPFYIPFGSYNGFNEFQDPYFGFPTGAGPYGNNGYPASPTGAPPGALPSFGKPASLAGIAPNPMGANPMAANPMSANPMAAPLGTPVGANLYVNNLPLSVDDAKLTKMFAPYGEILSAAIMTQETGKSRGFGFVCFATTQQASLAVSKLNDTTVEGHKLQISFAHRNPKVPWQMPMVPFGYYRPMMPMYPAYYGGYQDLRAQAVLAQLSKSSKPQERRSIVKSFLKEIAESQDLEHDQEKLEEASEACLNELCKSFGESKEEDLEVVKSWEQIDLVDLIQRFV